MNERYLGDRKDFVKYDLLLHFGRFLGLRGGLTIVPMLTPPRGRKQPEPYDTGARDAALHALLWSIASNLDLTFRQASGRVAAFFAERGLTMCFAPSDVLQAHTRQRYFGEIQLDSDGESLVFLDPDTGLEGSTTKSVTHLRYPELENICDRMSDETVLVVYQHWQHKDWEDAFSDIATQLVTRTSIRRAAFAFDREVALIATARSRDSFQIVCDELEQYARKVGLGLVRWDVEAGVNPTSVVALPAPKRRPCECGCGGYPKKAKSRFLPGHDMKRHL